MLNIKNIISISAEIKIVPFSRNDKPVYVFTATSDLDEKIVICTTTDERFYESYQSGGVVCERVSKFFEDNFQEKKQLLLIDQNMLPVDWLSNENTFVTDESMDVWDCYLDEPLEEIKPTAPLKLFFSVMGENIEVNGPLAGSVEYVLNGFGLFNKADWSIADDGVRGSVVYAKHSSGTSIEINRQDRAYTEIHIEMPHHITKALEETGYDYRPVLEEMCGELVDINEHAEISLEITTFTLHPKKEIAAEDRTLLEFDVLPFLITNTTKPIRLERVELVYATNVVEMFTSGLRDKNCLGVLLDFDDPTQSLALLDAAKVNYIEIYALRRTEADTFVIESVPINTGARRSRYRSN